MLRFLAYCFLILFVFVQKTNAQISEKGLPESFLLKEKNAVLLPESKLGYINIDELIAEDKSSGIGNRYGLVNEFYIDIKMDGAKTNIYGKGNIWRYRINSENSVSIGLLFSKYILPKDAKLFIYDKTGEIIFGAFTHRNNNAKNKLQIAEFPSQKLIIEYFEPINPEFSGELVLGAVSQAYRDFNISIIDRIGVNCPLGNDWKMQKNCVCLMTYHNLRFSYFCSGALLNNVKNDQKPFFLTANHCVNNELTASTLVTYFNYEDSGCKTYDASINQTLSGASILAGSNHTDFSLLLLNEYPPDEYNPYYAGWDAGGAEPNYGVSIHHPNGQPKCIAIDSTTITSYNEKVLWYSDDLSLTSTTLPNTHWTVQFSQGNSEYGSSGAPLFDQNKRIVGQLHGGTNFVLLYGKLSLSWNYNKLKTEQLAFWLDPENTTKKLDGIWKIPPKTNFRAELRMVCPDSPVMLYDESTQNPTEWNWEISPSTFKFVNNTDGHSKNPQVVFLNDGSYSVKLHSANKYGSDELVQQNYIVATKRINVNVVSQIVNNEVCAYDLQSYNFSATGAVSYKYSVDKPQYLDAKTINDKLVLSLKEKAEINKSFDTYIKVIGTNGICTATDSLRIRVIIQPNDNIANSAKLDLGLNTGFSNRCATVENHEPNPPSIDCFNIKSWCPIPDKSFSVLNNSVWFTFYAPANGLLTIKTHGFNNQIAVYKADSYSSILKGSKNFEILAANDNSSVSDYTASLENLKLVPHKKYWLQVDGNDGDFGDLTIDLISNAMRIFPNPSNGIVNIMISSHVSGNIRFIVSDLNGRKVFDNKTIVSLISNKYIMNLSHLVDGMYILNVSGDDINLSEKFVMRKL